MDLTAVLCCRILQLKCHGSMDCMYVCMYVCQVIKAAGCLNAVLLKEHNVHVRLLICHIFALQLQISILDVIVASNFSTYKSVGIQNSRYCEYYIESCIVY
jgi:hypothetical protein